MQPERNLCVYIHTSPSGKVYIGQTNNPKRRWNHGLGYRGTPHLKAAIDRYGWDSFQHEVVAEHLTQDEANALECILIEKYQATDPSFGYNIQSGGRSAGGMSPEAKERMAASKRGANSPNARPVTSFDLSGHRLLDFDCVSSAAQHYNIRRSTLLTSLSKGRGTCGGLIFHYSENVAGMERLPPKLVCTPHEKPSLRGGRNRLAVPIVLFASDGTKYKEFASIAEAAQELKVHNSSLNEALQTMGRKCAGYYPVYKEIADRYDKLPVKTFHSSYEQKRKVVSRYTPDGVWCGVYASISEAASNCGVTIHAVSVALRKGGLSGGYQWRYGAPDTLLVKPFR